MRTIRSLIQPDKNIIFYVKNSTVRCRFLLDAEQEGITLGNGKKPTEAAEEEYYVLHSDGTLYYLGWAGRMKLQTKQSSDYVRVDYEKYIQKGYSIDIPQ